MPARFPGDGRIRGQEGIRTIAIPRHLIREDIGDGDDALAVARAALAEQREGRRLGRAGEEGRQAGREAGRRWGPGRFQ